MTLDRLCRGCLHSDADSAAGTGVYTTQQAVEATGLSRRRLQSWVHVGILQAEIPGPKPNRWMFPDQEVRIAQVLQRARSIGVRLDRLRLLASMLRNHTHRSLDGDWVILVDPAPGDFETLDQPILAVCPMAKANRSCPGGRAGRNQRGIP
jgi:DNA-binding transcriptional MerR regulator